MLIVSTAHYSKFVDECLEVWDQIKDPVENPPKHEGIESCKLKNVIHTDVIEANYEDICQELSKFTESYFV